MLIFSPGRSLCGWTDFQKVRPMTCGGSTIVQVRGIPYSHRLGIGWYSLGACIEGRGEAPRWRRRSAPKP